MQGTPSIDKNANSKLEIRNLKQKIQYCFKHLGFYAFNVRIYFKFLFTAEAQRAPRGGIFFCRETTTNKKVHSLKIPINCLAAGQEIFAQSPSPDWAKGKFSANSASLRLNTYTQMCLFLISIFEFRILLWGFFVS